MLLYQAHNDPLEFNIARTKTHETSIIWNNVVPACMLTALIPHKQVVFTYAVCGTKGPRRFMQNILSGIQDHITVCRVYIRTELARYAKNVFRSWRISPWHGMHRFRSECGPLFRYSSLAGEVFILIRELRHVSFANAGCGGRRDRPTLIPEKKRSEKGIGPRSSEERSDNVSVFL